MTFFHQFSAFAASRGEGLHPKLADLLERAAASPWLNASMRHDGLIQAGPNPDSEIASARTNVTSFSRQLGAAATAFSPGPTRRERRITATSRDG